MRGLLRRIFGVRPGEGKKTLLLFGLHLLFYLGLMWGGFTREALFLNTWGADWLDMIFIANALLAFAMGIAYTFFADRITNEQLLFILVGLIAVWVGGVWVWLINTTNPGGWVYPFFYLAYGAISDLGTLHILNYINDFYDTRAAKRAIPLMLSAGIAGTALAGFSFKMLRGVISLENVPLAWLGVLALILILMVIINRSLSSELGEVRKAIQARRTAGEKGGMWSNLSSGFNFVRESALLRWLAVATFSMVVLMTLLTYQTSLTFQEIYLNDPDGLSDFYALVDGLSSVGSLIIGSLFLGRLVSRFGVGTMNTLFPLITLGSVGALAVDRTNFAASIFGRLDYKGIKQTFRNPLDAMLYNSVPLHVKARAKGFIGGLVVPMGTMAAGLLLVAWRFGLADQLPDMAGAGVAIAFALLYVFSALRIRSEYTRSLAKLLTEDQMNLFRLGEAGFDQVDPATLEFLYQHIEETESDESVVFLAELLYQIQEEESFVYLQQLVAKRGPVVRAGVIQLLGQEWLTHPIVRAMCLEGVYDEEITVRRAAMSTLVADPQVVQDETILNVLLEALEDEDEEIRTLVIPPLIASGDFFYLAPAVEVLSGWLSDEESSYHRALGLRVLAKTGSERLLRTLVRYLRDDASIVRMQAVNLIDDLAAQTPLEEIKALGLKTLSDLLIDRDESVRLAAVSGLARFQTMESSYALMSALGDESFAVRRLASELMTPAPRRELEECMDNDIPYVAESAAYVLARNGSNSAKREIIDIMENLIPEIYQYHTRRMALAKYDTPANKLFCDILQEQADLLTERVFWLLSALSNEEEAQAVSRAIQSEASITRANAVETLESMTNPQLAQNMLPLFESTTSETITGQGHNLFNTQPVSEWQVFTEAWPYLGHEPPVTELTALPDLHRTVVRMVMRHVTMAQHELRTGIARLPDMIGASASEVKAIVDSLIEQRWLIAEGSSNAPTYRANLRAKPSSDLARKMWGGTQTSLASLYGDGWLTAIAMLALWEANQTHLDADQEPLVAEYPFYQAVKATLEDGPVRLVEETARMIMSLAAWPGGEDFVEEGMLTTIEKVIFLREVLFFQEMTIDQLRVLAGISEEVAYDKGETILVEGDRGEAIYVVIDGKIGIQRRAAGRRDVQITRLAELGPREYFAEMSVFDNMPYSADAVALEPVSLLMVRQAPLMALIQQQPGLALDLLKVLSIRLRQANEQIAQRTKTRTKRLLDFFDEMEEQREDEEEAEEEEGNDKPIPRRGSQSSVDVFGAIEDDEEEKPTKRPRRKRVDPFAALEDDEE